jgi:RNA polymerase sigma-70 factor (ECF subfamily)
LHSVYAENARFVWRALRGMGVRDAEIGDAVQDVFIVVHRRYQEFDHRFKVRTWLFEIAYRVARDYRRKYARTRAVVPFEDNHGVSERNPADHAEQNDRIRLLHWLLDQLDEDKRAILVLTEFEGLTAPEVSELTGTPLNTVYTRLRRARNEFNEALARHERSQK